ncbi:DUF3440 domain-containing protein, partial [Bacteroides clarus]|uniref:DUF3440 domain-containing protein n=1 Tax=Bacteroides clarus TaxID=626929 RepID=UPI002101B682
AKLETSIKFWKEKGGVLSDGVIQKLKERNIPIQVGDSSNYKTVDLHGYDDEGSEVVLETIIVPPGGIIVKTYSSGSADNNWRLKEASTMYIWESYMDEDNISIDNPVAEKVLSPNEDFNVMAYYYVNAIRVMYITA